MTNGNLERSLRTGGLCVAAGLGVQFISFFWNHPLAFIAFAVVGGALVLGGVASFAWAAYRERAWRDRVISE